MIAIDCVEILLAVDESSDQFGASIDPDYKKIISP